MKLRNPSLIRLVGFVAAVVIRCWMGTIRSRLCLPDARQHPANPRRERFLYAFWHDSLLLPMAFKAPIHVLISQHADGELIAQACRYLRIGVIRGSTTRGGAKALLQLARWTRRSHLGV